MSKLLVVVDYQKDFVDGSLGFEKAKTLDEGIANLVLEYLANGDNIIVTYDTHNENYLQTREGKKLPVIHCIKNSDGFQLYGKTREQIEFTCQTNNIFCVNKTAFGMSPEQMLELKKQIDAPSQIMMVGVVTNMCVISNAVCLMSMWNDTQITIDASLTASFDDAMHEKALDVMQSMQMDIINR